MSEHSQEQVGVCLSRVLLNVWKTHFSNEQINILLPTFECLKNVENTLMILLHW